MDRILYTKYSNERDTRLRIKTQVIESDGQRYICKLPMSDYAKSHIESINSMHKKLTELYKDTNIKINKCLPYKEGVQFEFINGDTFEKKLDQHLAVKDYLGIIDLIKEYKSKIFGGIKIKQFVPTDEFKEVFGDVHLTTSLDAISVSNIDLIFSNIIVDGDGFWNIIDYEWTFDFNVPVNFIIYRALCDYLYSSNKRDELWHLDLLQLFDIDENEKQIYQEMDSSFHRYVSGDTSALAHINERINNTKYVVRDLLTTYIPGQVQVFYDYGDGFSEDNSKFVNCLKEQNGMYKLSIEDLDNVKSIRIDPSDQYCVAKILKLEIEKNEYGTSEESVEDTIMNNGIKIGESLFIYNTDDPQWILNNVDETYIRIDITFYLSCIAKNMAEIILSETGISEGIMSVVTEQKQREIELLKSQINEKDIELDNRLVELEHRMDVINERDRTIGENNTKIAALEKALNDERKKLEQVISQYENSKSWKLTKPVRALYKNISKTD